MATRRGRPSSWRDRPAAQQPEWPDEAALDRALKQIAALSPARVRRRGPRPARPRSAEVAAGKAFLLQAGDCAESLRRRSPPTTSARSCKVILQMAVVLTYSLGRARR